jgi:hypothetical protein
MNNDTSGAEIQGNTSMKAARRLSRCFTSRRVERACKLCGQRPGVVHIPTGHVGYYCERCCPACGRGRAIG